MADVARAREVLSGILERMGVAAAIDVREEADRVILDIKGPEAGLVIGKKGTTLDALQYLIGKCLRRDGEDEESRRSRPVMVDSEGYRTRREATLAELAHRMGEKAVRSGRAIAVSPMSPHDRRVIHLALAKVPGVTTRSEGEGVFRRLLIVPAPDKV